LNLGAVWPHPQCGLTSQKLLLRRLKKLGHVPRPTLSRALLRSGRAIPLSFHAESFFCAALQPHFPSGYTGLSEVDCYRSWARFSPVDDGACCSSPLLEQAKFDLAVHLAVVVCTNLFTFPKQTFLCAFNTAVNELVACKVLSPCVEMTYTQVGTQSVIECFVKSAEDAVEQNPGIDPLASLVHVFYRGLLGKEMVLRRRAKIYDLRGEPYMRFVVCRVPYINPKLLAFSIPVASRSTLL
jgi:hypothetical protein